MAAARYGPEKFFFSLTAWCSAEAREAGQAARAVLFNTVIELLKIRAAQ
jgi:hypothetical protein